VLRRPRLAGGFLQLRAPPLLRPRPLDRPRLGADARAARPLAAPYYPGSNMYSRNPPMPKEVRCRRRRRPGATAPLLLAGMQQQPRPEPRDLQNRHQQQRKPGPLSLQGAAPARERQRAPALERLSAGGLRQLPTAAPRRSSTTSTTAVRTLSTRPVIAGPAGRCCRCGARGSQRRPRMRQLCGSAHGAWLEVAGCARVEVGVQWIV
jgi:hypothetical protein